MMEGKQITLSRNSKHVKYYKQITGKEPPMSLCPYFWTWVLIILTSPLLLLYKLLKPVHMKVRGFDKEYKFIEKSGKVFNMLYIYSAIAFVVIVSCMGIYEFFIKNGLTFLTVLKLLGNVVLVLAMAFSIIAILMGTLMFFITDNEKVTTIRGKITYPIKKMFQIIKAMVIAIYEKNCPLINWK